MPLIKSLKSMGRRASETSNASISSGTPCMTKRHQSTKIRNLKAQSTHGTPIKTVKSKTSLSSAKNDGLLLSQSSLVAGVMKLTNSVGADRLFSWYPDENERALLKRTWVNDRKVQMDIGLDIYIHLFDASPASRSLFPDVPKANILARRHNGLRSQVGAVHTKYANRGSGFSAGLWKLFEDSLRNVLCKKLIKDRSSVCNSPDEKCQALTVWAQYASLVIEQVQIGYTNTMSAKES